MLLPLDKANMRNDLETVDLRLQPDIRVGRVTMNRPDAMNALSDQLISEVVTAFRSLAERNEDHEGMPVRAVVLEGANGNFCAGADITEFDEFDERDQPNRSHYKFLREYPLPVVAKIEGVCFGGGFETALSCDFRVAATDSRFGLPEVDLGLLPGAGGVPLVSMLANPSVAKELAMIGEPITAARAQELGLLNQVAAPDDLESTVTEMATTLASKPPLAIQAIKRSAAVAVESCLETGVAYDAEQIKSLLDTEDVDRGVRAFMEDGYEAEFVGR